MVKKQSHKKLFENIKAVLYEARNAVARNINTAMVMTYFDIGRMIVIDEQQGKKRAGYAEETLKNLSLDLTKEFGKGFSERNLENMRKFCLLYASKISHKTFLLSWSHYVFLIRLPENERNFYEIEAMKQNWSLRELERQFNSSLYERLALSRDKHRVKELSQKGHVLSTPQDAIKEPYVLEFLGLKEESSYSETAFKIGLSRKTTFLKVLLNMTE